MDSFDILVIILSFSLFISLVVWIFVGVVAIQIFKKIKSASETAAQAVINIEELTLKLKSAGKATAVGLTINQIIKVFKGRK